jgi:alginate O-acetyltransferase complex protein AlgI
MIFTELRFIFFFALVFSIYWIIRSNTWRKGWLLLCSYIFYSVWDWRFLSLIVVSTIVDYFVGLKLEHTEQGKERNAYLLLSLVVNLGILGFFKYYNFFIDSAYSLFQYIGIPANLSSLEVILPVGISFYTFQTLSYSLDIYLGKLTANRNFLNFALFVGFFPQLVAGPIVRASSFLPQLKELRFFNDVDVRGCLVLFLIGYFKKACISDNLARISDQYFAAPELYSSYSAVIGVVFYVVQFYCDFSGYSDMAIASAGLLGYKLPLNFNFPYFASDIAQLWRRWHISLSQWLRDYLYFPLEKQRKRRKGNTLASHRNLVLTMSLCGLWHGAGWNYIVWGTAHGMSLVVHRVWSKQTSPYKLLNRIMIVVGPLLTFYWFCWTGIFFRALDFDRTLITLKAFTFFSSPGQADVKVDVVWVLIPLILIHWLAYRRAFTGWYRKLPDWAFASGIGVFVFLCFLLVPYNYEPFIYFQF